MVYNVKEQPKRKRGRPKKEPVKLPEFSSDNDVREFLIEQGLFLCIQLIDIATKKNNIKNTDIARAKTGQYKTALEGLRIVNSLLKEKQLNDFDAKIKLMEETISTMNLTASSGDPKEVSKAVEKLNLVNQQLALLKSEN